MRTFHFFFKGADSNKESSDMKIILSCIIFLNSVMMYFCSLSMADLVKNTSPFTIVQGKIKIVSPLNGTVVKPGEKVTVEFQPEDGVEFTQVLLASLGNVQIVSEPPWRIEVIIPKDIITGTFRITGLGKNEVKNVLYPDAEITLKVVSDAVLELLSVEPSEIHFLDTEGAPDNYQYLRVKGSYTDGIERDLSRGRTGTTYLSSDLGVTVVTEDGRVSPVGKDRGNAEIKVCNNRLCQQVRVMVTGENENGERENGGQSNGISKH